MRDQNVGHWLQNRAPSSKLAIMFALVWLSAEFVLLGKYSFIYTGDNATALVPGLWNLQFVDSYFPLWNRFSTGGWDRTAINPIGWINHGLFKLLPGWLAYQTNIVGQIIVAFCGTYWLGREILRLSTLAAFFAAFMFSAIVTGQLHYASGALLPAILISLTLVIRDQSKWLNWVALATTLVVVSHTAWFAEMVPFTSAAIVTWFLFVDFRRKATDWVIIVVAALSLILLRLPDLLLLIEYGSLSNRADLAGAPSPYQWPWLLGNVGNVVSILLIAAALCFREARSRQAWGILGAVIVWTALPYIVAILHDPITSILPLLDGYGYFERASHVSKIMLAFCAGYGVHILLGISDNGRWFVWGRRFLLALAVFAALYGSYMQKKVVLIAWITQGNMVLNYQSPDIADLATQIARKPIPERVEPFQIYPAYLHAYGIETAGGMNGVYSGRYHEFWGEVVRPYFRQGKSTSNQSVNRWITTEPGNPPTFQGVMLMLTTEDHKPERRLADLYQLNLLSLANVGYFISRDKLVDDSLEPLTAPSKPWNSLTSRQKVRKMIADNFYGRRDLYVYRNRNVLPRFFSVENVRRLPDGTAVREAMARATISELRRTMFVEDRHWQEGQMSGEKLHPAEIQVDSYSSDEIRLTVVGSGPSALFVGNSYSPYWVARVDGRVVPIFLANHTFWGLFVPPGSKSVVFRYEPPTARHIPDFLRFPSQ